MSPHRATRPNILWLVAEDMCPDLGCYGDLHARTPNIDRLAAAGRRFTNAYSHAPVCSPARSALITGMPSTSLGSQHLRSVVRLPEEVRCFTEHLRSSGYYCFNGYSRSAAQTGSVSPEGYLSKFDYNFDQPRMDDPLPAWDAVGGRYPDGVGTSWRDRAPGQPFFGQVNFIITHSSQYGTRHLDPPPSFVPPRPLTRVKPGEKLERDAVSVPGYQPDTPEVRELWSQYYACVAEMDHQVGELLEDLERDGLSEETIVFFFADNGMGVLGGKCWTWEQGIHVPLIVSVPPRYRHLVDVNEAEVDERMISFEDFAPTVLELAEISPPDHMMGHGFLTAGGGPGSERDFVIGIRDRIDHRPEFIRTVRDRRYQYARNFLPDRGYDYSAFYWQHAPAALGEWAALARATPLEGRRGAFFADSKPAEELYDLKSDPYQLRNLAHVADYVDVLTRMRRDCYAWMIETRDLGLLAEHDMHERSHPQAPRTMALDPERYPIERILRAADGATRPGVMSSDDFLEMAGDSDAGVRRWAAVGLRRSGSREDVDSREDVEVRRALQRLRGDGSLTVRVAAAEGLASAGELDDALATLDADLDHRSGLALMAVLDAIDRLGGLAAPLVPRLERLDFRPDEQWLDPRSGTGVEPHVPLMLDLILTRFGRADPRRLPLYADVDLGELTGKQVGWSS